MKINLTELSYKDKIEINDDVIFPDSYKNNAGIMDLKNIHVEGFFRQNDLDEYVCNLHVTGQIVLEDSVTLNLEPYNIDFVINENLEEILEKKQNMLDIVEFLWQNIVLEVPIRYTKGDATCKSGDNWKIIDECSKQEIDPRMQKLNDYYKGGE